MDWLLPGAGTGLLAHKMVQEPRAEQMQAVVCLHAPSCKDRTQLPEMQQEQICWLLDRL